jgi:hypothetical protein
MVTGYEVQMYQDIAGLRRAVERIAKVLEDQRALVPCDECGAMLNAHDLNGHQEWHDRTDPTP